MKNIAIFTGKVINPANAEEQKVNVIVGCATGSKVFGHLVYTLDTNELGESSAVWMSCDDEHLLEDFTIVRFFTEESITMPGFDSSLGGCIKNLKDIVITHKIDEIYAAMNHEWCSPLLMEDAEELSNANTLQNYMEHLFTFDDNFEILSNNSMTTYPILFKEEILRGNSLDESPYFTDEEKALCHPRVDLDVSMNNSKRVSRALFEKVMSTNYPSRGYSLVGLHGAPGSGKSAMAVVDYCALNNIPVIQITASASLTIAEIMAQTGPVTKPAMINKSDVEGYINSQIAQMAALSIDSQKAVSEGRLDDASAINNEIKKITELLAQLKDLTTEQTTLVKSYSILAKAFIHNVGIVCVIDEANLLHTQELNALAPIITEHTFNDGPNTFRNDNTIKWVLCWNPGTSNTKTFDGKFYDRIWFMNIENVAEEEVRKRVSGMNITAMYGSKQNEISTYIAELDALIQKSPEKAKQLEFAKKIIADNASYASSEAIAWFKNHTINKLFGGKISDSGLDIKYAGENHQLSGEEVTKKTLDVIYDLLESVNEEMHAQTSGKDTKNPDKTASFYIPNPRDFEIFADYIYMFRNVDTAVSRAVADFIPGGNTLSNCDRKVRPSKDVTPYVIASNVIFKLTNKIKDAQRVLFSEVTEEDKERVYNLLDSAVFDANFWLSMSAEELASLEIESGSLGIDENNASQSDSFDINKDLDDLLGV